MLKALMVGSLAALLEEQINQTVASCMGVFLASEKALIITLPVAEL
jgi:hypothetical protein